MLDEINERAVEEALLIREKEAADGNEGRYRADRRPGAGHRGDPQGAVHGRRQGRPPARRRAPGSDVVQTGWALARALGTIEGIELVIAGNESSDGIGGAVPAIIAEYLGLPQLTHAQAVARGRQDHR